MDQLNKPRIPSLRATRSYPPPISPLKTRRPNSNSNGIPRRIPCKTNPCITRLQTNLSKVSRNKTRLIGTPRSSQTPSTRSRGPINSSEKRFPSKQGLLLSKQINYNPKIETFLRRKASRGGVIRPLSSRGPRLPRAIRNNQPRPKKWWRCLSSPICPRVTTTKTWTR